MKRIFFGSNGNKPPHMPFWKPWGAWGCLWRGAAFMFLLAILVLLLSLLRSCNHDPYTAEIPDSILHPEDGPIPSLPVDTVGDFPDNNIADPGPYLPGPDDNFLPPVYDDDLITDPDDGRQYVSNLLNVMLNSESDDSTFRKWAEEFKKNYPGDDYAVKFYDPLTKLLQISVPAERAQALITELPEKITDISFLVFPEGLMGSWASRPKDPAFREKALSWYFAPIQAYQAWEVTMGKPEVVIAIVDTYFDLHHDELNSDRIFKPFSISRRDANVLPPRGGDDGIRCHGTLVASLAAGNINNNRGACGIAPKCRLMPVSMGNHLTSMTMLQGLLYSIYQGASVVNISAGAVFGPEVASIPPREQVELSKKISLAEEAVWKYAFKIADEKKVTVVWAAGNDNIFTALDPSKRGSASVKVSAVGPNLRKTSFSDFGNFPQWGVNECTVSAPGEKIFGAIPFNSYDVEDGTSFSAPIVAGAIALMKSVNPNLTNKQVNDILRTTGAPVPDCPTIGPLLKIRAALDKAKATR